jgi:sodium/proline symporter
MTRPQVLVLMLVVYALLGTAIAVWAHRRTHHPNDYLIAGRRASGWLVGLSQGLNIVPAWLMLTICASAFTLGMAAVWVGIGVWLGGLLQACYVAPRARKLSTGQHSVSLVQLLSCESGERLQRNIVWCAALLVGVATVVMIVVQLQLVAQLLAPTSVTGLLGLTVLAAFLILVGTAGWWAYAAFEAIHAAALLLIAAITFLLAWSMIGGSHEVVLAMRSMPPEYLEWDGGRKLVIAAAATGGALCLAVLPLGQPALLSRAIAIRDEQNLRTSGLVLILWLTLLLPILLGVGWLARALYFGLQNEAFALLEIGRRTLHPAVSGGMAIIVSGALLTNVIAQLGVLSTLLVNDLRPRKVQLHPEWSRVWIVLAAIVVLLLFYRARTFGFTDLMLCWTALGAALAPLLVVRLAGKRVRAGSTIGAMCAGFLLVLIFHLMPDAPGDFLERVLPFVASIGVALSGGERRRNPDRADRSEETVHDRLPI